MAVQRNLKALGTFGYQASVRGNTGLPARRAPHAGLPARHLRAAAALRAPAVAARAAPAGAGRLRTDWLDAPIRWLSLTDGRFGLSTRLFLDERLEEGHIAEIAAQRLLRHRSGGAPCAFRLPPTPTPWLAWPRGWPCPTWRCTRCTRRSRPRWPPATKRSRARAVDEVCAALEVARHVPYRYLVLHLGHPRPRAAPGDNQPGAARRSLEEIVERLPRSASGWRWK